MKSFFRVIALSALLPLFVLVHAATLNVDLNSSAPTSPYGGRSTPATNTQEAIDVATSGDLLAMLPTESVATLRCIFQRMEGRATAYGLWITSTVDGAKGTPFQVKAVAVGRGGNSAECRHAAALETSVALPAAGSLSVEDKVVRYLRDGLTEEYTVSMDGLRQDFVVLERPETSSNLSPLRVELAVDGAQVEWLVGGARLVLDDGGRKIAYNRLRVTDANGKELVAKIDVAATRKCDAEMKAEDGGGLPTCRYAGLAIVVNDAEATYPVRIDPTFSDANWISLGAFPGADGVVNAAVVDGSGNLYIGGGFTVAGNTNANFIAKWDGSSWSALGSGMNNWVYALAVSGSDLYAGGWFTTAGGIAANYIAKWDGSSWSTLGSGMNNVVWALAVSGSNVYAGGGFTSADGVAANHIAKWNGSSWSALGSGMNNAVLALAVSGSDMYAGGGFTSAGGSTANYIAKWNGSSWSVLGEGMNDWVYALAVSGSDLYAGGGFTSAGGSAANFIAKRNGSSWSALGEGMNNDVRALAVSGSGVYAGGGFTSAGGVSANRIAEWNGSSWSALGSGMDGNVRALTVSGSDVYAGGDFSTAGGKISTYVARAVLQSSPQFTHTVLQGANLVLSGSGGAAGGIYYLLATTTVTAPMTNWVCVATNTFAAGGSFSVTNPITVQQRFFRIQVP